MRAKAAQVGHLFRPGSVALVGASEKNYYAASLIQNLGRFGFASADIYLVNPGRKEAFGKLCYRSVSEVPAELDVAAVVVSRDHVVRVLEECADKGVRAAVVVATGFREFDEKGRGLQAEISRLAELRALAICGPNTLGLFSHDGGAALWCAPLPPNLRKGSVGAVFQSGGLLNVFLSLAAARCLGIRYAVAPGNEADLCLTDYLSWLVEDPEVRVIPMLMESVERPEEMFAFLDRARALQKPVVALRVGRSARGGRAVVSHTGNLATSSAVWETLFRQKGVIAVDTIDEMLEATILLEALPPWSGRSSHGIGLMTISGGDCSYLSDICDRVAVRLPDPSPATYEALASFFGKEKFNGNPLDVEDLHLMDEEKFYACLKVFMTEESFDVIGCRLSLPKGPDERLMKLYTRAAAVSRDTGKKIVFLSRASEYLDHAWFEFFSELGVPLLMEYEKGLRAIRGLLWASSRRGNDKSDVALVEHNRADVHRLKGILASSRKGVLNYRDSREVLSVYEIPLAPEGLARSAEEAVALARQLGFPVAMKVSGGAFPHKTEVGGVLLNVEGEQAVERRFHELLRKGKENSGDSEIEGILLQKMVPGIVELIVGTVLDPQLGPVVMVGLGGVHTELLRDVSVRVAPISPQDAWEMVEELKGKELLYGHRGKPKADVKAIVEILLRISQLAYDLREELDAVELNPVMALPEGEGALAVDTLLTRESDAGALNRANGVR